MSDSDVDEPDAALMAALDDVIVSPGFAPHTPVARAALRAGLPVYSEPELAWRLRGADAPAWLAVTGTNGKTTTTTMLAAMLAAAGHRTEALGNIGEPLVHAALAPDRFDVLVMENLFGDVISDLCAGLVGGLGLVPGANVGTRYAVFEAVHGSAPDIAGKGLANPIAVVRSAAMLLDHIGQREAAHRVERAVLRTLEAGTGLTRDLGGDGTTRTVADQLIANLVP